MKIQRNPLGTSFSFHDPIFCLGMAGIRAEEGVPDMTTISDMNENGVNRNLQVRSSSQRERTKMRAYCTIGSKTNETNVLGDNTLGGHLLSKTL